jgi:hypothetical protein
VPPQLELDDVPEEEAVLDGDDVGVVVEGVDVDEGAGAAAAVVLASFFAAAPESTASWDGGFILSE